MFGIDSSELFMIGLVALLVIGPARLPSAMRTVGQWVAKGRAMTRHVRTGFDAMIREAELEEMQKSWAKHNDAIMKATAGDPMAFLEGGNNQAAAVAMAEDSAIDASRSDPLSLAPPASDEAGAPTNAAPHQSSDGPPIAKPKKAKSKAAAPTPTVRAEQVASRTAIKPKSPRSRRTPVARASGAPIDDA